MNDKAYWIWLQQALGYAVKVDEIVSTFGHAKKVYEASHEERARSGAFTPRQLTKIRNTPLSVVDDIIQGCRECKCRVLTPDDERYPKKLFDLQDYPLVLYYLGDPDVLKNRMTIIGPANAGIGKINDVYRSCLIFKHKDKEVLKKAKFLLEQWLSTCGIEGKIVQFDFNPMNSF